MSDAWTLNQPQWDIHAHLLLSVYHDLHDNHCPMPKPESGSTSQPTSLGSMNDRTVVFAPSPDTSLSDMDKKTTTAATTSLTQSQSKNARSRPEPLRALSLRAVKLSNLPRKNAVISEAQQLLSSSRSWKPSKAYNGIKTYTQTLPTITSSSSSSSSAPLFSSSPSSSTAVYADTNSTPYITDIPWYCVAHQFKSVPPPDTNTHEPTATLYTHLWSKISQDRIRNQPLYTPEITSVTDIKTLSRTQSIWSVTYDFGSPLSPRVFTMLQIIKLVDTIPRSRTGIVISVPVDLNTSTENLAVLEDLGVKARYITIEHLKEYNGGTLIEWRKLMCGEFGGLVPRFCVRRSMPEKMALDATRFIQWIIRPENITQLQQQRERDEAKQEVPSRE